MSDNGELISRWAGAEPGRWLGVSLSANHRRDRSERLEAESIPACGAEALPGLCGPLPGQSMARRSPRLKDMRIPSSGGGRSHRSTAFSPATGRGSTNQSGRGQRRSLRSIRGGGRVPRGVGGAALPLMRHGRGGREAVKERRGFYSGAERWSKYREILPYGGLGIG